MKKVKLDAYTLATFLLAFLAVAFSAPQQNAGTPPPQPEIRGVVLEPGTNQPVVDAEIIIGGVMGGDKPVSRPVVMARKWPPQAILSPSGTVAARGDEAGQFRIAGLAPGEYHVIALRSLDPATNQAALERALAAAKKVEVGPNGIQNVTLEVTDLR
jgi:hypothetical protein